MRDWPDDERPGASTAAFSRDFPAPGWPSGPEHERRGRPASWPGEEGWSPRGRTGRSGDPAVNLDWLLTESDLVPKPAHHSPISPEDGAPPGGGGRFAAEWRRSGTSSRGSSLLRERGRTGGGVMVRRAILDRGDELTADDEEPLPPVQPPATRPDQVPSHWRGSGGRWLVWAGRAVIWAVILLIGYRGVLAIVTGDSAAPASQGAAAGTTTFPVTLADAYALEFGEVYLNFSPATADTRAAALAAFLPPGSAQLGWNGAGAQKLLSEQVAATSVTGSQTAVVTLLARVSGAGLIELGVPVYTEGGKVVVTGRPSWLGAPARAVPPRQGRPAGDQHAEAALRSQLPAFFQSYASGDQSTLARYTTTSAQITGLSGAVSFGSIDAVYAPPGGSRRTVLVTVTWLLAPVSAASAIASAPASLEATYQLAVVHATGSWDVASIGTSTSALAQGPP